jgi:HEAT repeat protein
LSPLRPFSLIFVAAILICACAFPAAAQDNSAAALADAPSPDEPALIAVLQSDAGWLEKQTACRALRVKGTAASVPALAALLADKELSSLARFALEPMECPEAGKALREALGSAEGLVKVGMITSLGVRRDEEALPMLLALLNDSDDAIARAAAAAVGRIGTEGAADALLKMLHDYTGETFKGALAEGALAAGQRLEQNGKKEAAARVFAELMALTLPPNACAGAFYGLARTQPGEAPQYLLGALAGTDPLLRDIAARVIGETSGADTTKLYAEALPTLPGSGQAALLRSFAARNDPTAHAAVARALSSVDANVRKAAIQALATLGVAADVAPLAAQLQPGTETGAAAVVTLTLLDAEGVNAALAAALPGTPPPARVQLFDILVNRRAEQTAPLALANVEDADVTVRVAALRALAAQGGANEVPALLKSLAKAADDPERAAAEKALAAVCPRSGEPALPLLLAAMNGAGIEVRLGLLRVVARVGGPKAVETVAAGLGDADEQYRSEAARLLSDWPGLEARPHLLIMAQSDDLSRQVLGLRGYVRLVGAEPSAEEKVNMLTKAMELAKRPDEQKLVLGGWGSVKTPQALDFLIPRLDEPNVQAEAAVAIISIAGELIKADATKARATEALTTILTKSTDPSIHERVAKALAGQPQ